MRIGFGYDVHPLIEGRPLILGGSEIAFERGLGGHSDADVLVHAVIDAILGAAAMRDIGFHFPDSDPRYRDMSSMILLKETGAKLVDRGFRIANIDSTIVCAGPRLADYIDGMIGTMSAALDIDRGRVSVKASSSNGVGPLGRGEGIAAYAVALIEETSE